MVEEMAEPDGEDADAVKGMLDRDGEQRSVG
jgi:hypothetical protein